MELIFSYEGKHEETPMRAKIERMVRDRRDKIIREKLDPWWRIGTSKGFCVTEHSGRTISSAGCEFAGSLTTAFWSKTFMPPFLEAAVEGVFEDVAGICQSHALPPEDYLAEATGYLRGMVTTVYLRMAHMEATLSRSRQERNVREYVQRMERKIEDHRKATRLLAEVHRKPNGPGTASEVTDKPRPRNDSVRDCVFVSYSHKDERMLGELLDHLKPYTRNELLSTWSDKDISPGEQWFTEIKAALDSAKVGVLLVTKDFLASEFIVEHELTPLLKHAEAGKVKIIWIPVGACSYKETRLKDYQAATDLAKPLAGMSKHERDEAWVKICEAIKEAVSAEE